VSGQINLYNAALRAKQHYITGPTVLLAALVIGVGVLGAQGYQQVRIAALTKEAADVEARLKDRQDEVAHLTADVKRLKPQKRTVAEVAAAEALLRGHQQVAAAVDAGLIGTTEGFSDFMRALARRAVPGIWLNAVSVDASGGGMSISGKTLDPNLLPGYIKRLNQETVIRGRGFVFLELQLPKPEKHYHEFVLRVDASGDDLAGDSTGPADAPTSGAAATGAPAAAAAEPDGQAGSVSAGQAGAVSAGQTGAVAAGQAGAAPASFALDSGK
jgi:hypothetical protein